MGYTTDFCGEFRLDRPLEPLHHMYLKQFAETRRMARDEEAASKLLDPVREAANLPVGPQGDYFVGGEGWAGQEHDASIINYNQEPAGQPGLWCQWVPTEDGEGIVWDGSEKFYAYTEWLTYIIDNFLRRWDYVLNGEVEWQGEESGDIGKLVVVDNTVICKPARIVYD